MSCSPSPTYKYIQQRERIDDYGKKQTQRDKALPFMGHHFLPTLIQAFLECLKAFLPTLSNLFLPYWKVLRAGREKLYRDISGKAALN